MNEERTTEEERRYILEARKRALANKKKLKTLGKRSRSTDSDEEEEEIDGKKICAPPTPSFEEHLQF